jgi:hypothetical protein
MLTVSNTPIISDKHFISMMDKEGYRWTRKTFTRPRGRPLYRETPAGAELKQKTEEQVKLGNMHTRSELTSLPNNREQFIISSCWTDREAYHEFEQWYIENAKQKVIDYEKANDITHEYTVEALDSSTTVEEHLRKSFIEKMSFRRNITFFDQEKIPEKSVIEKILKNAFELVPILQCVYPFHVKIWGPEYAEMKKQLVLRSICGPNQKDFRPGGKYEGNWKKCEEIYDAWISHALKTNHPDFYDGYYFNQQIVAPYLISWHPVPIIPTQSQLDQGYIEQRALYNKGIDNDVALIGTSMHGYGMSILCANEGLSASFTRNILNNVDTVNTLPEAIKPVYLESKYGTVPFVLGIGYQNNNILYNGDANNGIKPSYDEIHFWK